MRRWVVIVLAFAVLAAAAVHFGRRVGPPQTRHQPVAIRFLGEGGDPLVIMVGIEWHADGWCSGQFVVTAAETSTEVRVFDVVSRTPRGNGGCAGLGSDGRTAWVDLTMSAPLGARTAVRAADGHVLPIVKTGP
ncbi:hypothetical protein OHA72_31765 [Dactylosporangium sp. NBC_01737]|uniref:hypothetical protein n=1 Tax=Dactylosporangium sp. NBC_01737 TaxID=2975959 RepID=UPI002E1026B0|nr:hypothetical protein OHA72_31765 [Dactylosporangium sp. NBC_01737]